MVLLMALTVPLPEPVVLLVVISLAEHHRGNGARIVSLGIPGPLLLPSDSTKVCGTALPSPQTHHSHPYLLLAGPWRSTTPVPGHLRCQCGVDTLLRLDHLLFWLLLDAGGALWKEIKPHVCITHKAVLPRFSVFITTTEGRCIRSQVTTYPLPAEEAALHVRLPCCNMHRQRHMTTESAALSAQCQGPAPDTWLLDQRVIEPLTYPRRAPFVVRIRRCASFSTAPGHKNLFSFSSCVDGPGIWRACTYSMGTPRGSAEALEAPVNQTSCPRSRLSAA